MDFGWHWKTLPVLLTVAEQFQPHKKGFGATKVQDLRESCGVARLRDQSRGKEQTLALLDRCLKMATHFLRNGGWNW